MKKSKDGFYIQLSPEEKMIIKELKEKHAINISQLIKNFLREYYKKEEIKSDKIS